MVTANPVITAWSAVSPFGIGREAFADGLRSGRPTGTTLSREQWQVPDERAHLVPDFDIREVLGKKGTRSMDRVSGLAVTAVRELLADTAAREMSTAGVGLVLGTTTGSAQSLMDFSRDSFTEAKPYFVDAARFPNAVMNCASGQCAIWHQLKGPNATVAGGRAAGLYALNYARRLLGAGRAEVVLCGAVEEYSHARSWLEHHSRGEDERESVLGEGCGILMVEPDGGDGEALAEVLAVEFGVVLGDDYRGSLESCVRRALRRAGLSTADVTAVAPCGAPGRAGEQERELLADLFPPGATERVLGAELLGDTAAASALFQLLALFGASGERVALVTSLDRTGVVGCALLRVTGR
ncbi:hypothetical protein JIG36_28635 [Actinoplanes sp. LDG1-06]|uniref:Beta-ketoacyl synthase-like N-terminal domain-containing protein n=1 Tax=Paractinoplanes ovalisporus TaxID=2810368 RepID=A0ABS2AI54_9ACTN|nr:beta-ketoacyl synthase N-terminal-like domain-containing protein [Actinoplanes ovalisporus]MBM2619528.1 hypothetical protein [Actinoplanes ovalisporus]